MYIQPRGLVELRVAAADHPTTHHSLPPRPNERTHQPTIHTPPTHTTILSFLPLKKTVWQPGVQEMVCPDCCRLVVRARFRQV